MLRLSSFEKALPPEFVKGEVAWFGASSFEERCLGSLRRLQQSRARIRFLVQCDYPTRANPADAANALKRIHRAAMATVARSTGCRRTEIVELADRTESGLAETVCEFLDEANALGVVPVLDVSCFTKVHTMMIACIVGGHEKPAAMYVCYTTPQNYSGMAEDRQDFDGYSRTVVAPLVNCASLASESAARGIVLLGHEEKRLLVALAELEPPSGILVHPITDGRPDFSHRTRRQNKEAIARLHEFGFWNLEHVPYSDTQRLESLTAREALLAKRGNGALLLYPFGPKSHVFVSALVASQEYPEASWFVYPVPSFHDPHSAQGVATTVWAKSVISARVLTSSGDQGELM